MGGGETSDVASGQPQGSDDAALADAVHVIVDRAKNDPDFGAVAVMAARNRGFKDIFDWAAAEPVMVIALADALTGLDLTDSMFEEAMEKHRQAQRDLAP